MLSWQGGKQYAMGFKHQGNGKRKRETTSNKTGSIFLHQREEGESHTLSDGQQGSLVLLFENGGNKERKYDQIEQRDLALSSKSQYGYHSRIPAFGTEYSSR